MRVKRVGKQNMESRRQMREGFTLVELALSLVFIAILSLALALVINNTVISYRRGLTLGQINTTGMDLVDDMRAAIQGSSTKSLTSECLTYFSNNNDRTRCENDNARGFVSVGRRAQVTLIGADSNQSIGLVPVFGAFCTGTYSYIWNSGYFFDSDRYSVGVEMASVRHSGGDETGFRLLKVRDESRAICAAALGGKYNMATQILSGGTVFDISEFTLSEEPIDLLASDEGIGGLAIYDLTSNAPAGSGALGTLFYAVSFILGTIQGGININTVGNFCAVPSDYEYESFDYCAINKFNFAAQATGE